jgi:nitroreductase
VIISADLGRAARKYGPRAYRLALIECGAAMQNAYLVAAGMGVPIRAMLGIVDPPAADLLELPEGVVPLLAVFLGI